MKTRTTFIAICAAAALMSGCTDRQMVGTMAGSTMGGIFGSSIGGLMGGPRGSDAGTAIGMLAGGVIGNAVASASESRAYDEYEARAANRSTGVTAGRTGIQNRHAPLTRRQGLKG